MKQAQAVDIAYILGGEVVSTRRLSKRGEWRAAALALGSTAGLGAGAALIVAGALAGAHRVVFGPAFLMVWAALGLGGAALAAWRAAARASSGVPDRRRYRRRCLLFHSAGLGRPRPERAKSSDATRPRVLWPVARRSSAHSRGKPRRQDVGGRAAGHGWACRAAAGTGDVRPVERARSRRPRAGPAERGSSKADVPAPLDAPSSELRGLRQPLLRRAAGRQIGEAEMRSAIPANATPVGDRKAAAGPKRRRKRARFTSASTSWPHSCQRPGYSRGGCLALRAGEIRSHWIARSTYGADCPVNECLSDVVSTWFFEPLPEPIKVILVQVLRTDKPLPWGHARAAADAERNGAVAERTTTQAESASRTH